MTPKQLLQIRLTQQQLLHSSFTDPASLVAWMGAVQAQDYAMSKWAVGMRLKNATDITIEDALVKGTILRTHILRPTWHFVAAADIRWMLQLSAPRVHAYIGHYYRKLGLDKKLFNRSNKVLEKILQGKQYLTRTEIAAAWEKAKIDTGDLRLNHLLIYAELEGLICSGPIRGKHITYALLEERVPAAKQFSREESMYELALRYYQSHGPASLKDFAWWSGLSLTDVRQAIASAGNKLLSQKTDTETYYYPDTLQQGSAVTSTLLLPNFDEYVVAYADKSLYTGKEAERLLRSGNPLFSNTVVVNGQVAGIWKRSVKTKTIEVSVETGIDLPAAREKQLREAIRTFKNFYGSAL